MRAAYILIPDFGVDHGGVDIGMTEEPLNLLHGHPVTEQDCGDCVPENMRSDAYGERATSGPDDAVNGILHGLGIQRLVGLALCTGKDVGRIIGTGIEIRTETNLGLRVEVGLPGDISLPMLDEDGLLFPVNIVDASVTEFRDTNPGRVQEIDHGFIPERFASVTEIFQLNRLHGMAR